RYSVITSGSQTIREGTIDLATQMSTNFEHGEKLLIFSPSIGEVKSLEESLQCCMYYSRWDGKDDSLIDWRAGLHPTMVASSVEWLHHSRRDDWSVEPRIAIDLV